VKHQETRYGGSKNLRIYAQSWLPDRVRASVVVCHGLGEHSGRYAHVATALVNAGCAVHALDHRGHGRSEGPRALLDRFSNAVADIDSLVERVRRQHAREPLFLLGHSMGGALALGYALRYQDKLSGLVLSSPAVSLDGLPPLLSPFSKLLSEFLPRLGLYSVAPNLVSRDQGMVAGYVADPLNHHGRVPVRTVAEIIRFVEGLPSKLPALKLPLLLMHGKDDKLVRVSASQRVHDGVTSTDKTLKIYDGLYHEIFNELPRDRARVLKDLTRWIDQHMAA